ncbi:MAG TPA: response regulator [Candidatus Saccharimonadales bacterium]|nr:response regulator [Candidatus Saccharimonadales bacterium]
MMNNTTNTSKTVLIVEDELPFRQIYREAFSLHGYNVIEAEDGQEALQVAEQQSPDLVLLDIILPKLTGFDVLTKLKTDPAYKHIPVIVYSVLDNKADIERAMKLGADDFTIKGQTPAAEVLQKARALLGE